MIGLTDLEVYNSSLNKTEESYKFELYKNPDKKSGGITYEKVRDEIERDLDNSDLTATDLHGDIIGPNITEEYREQLRKRMRDDNYMKISANYNRSIFQDFKGFLRTETDWVEDDIKLVLDENNSSSITYEITPGIYTFKDLSEALPNLLQPEYDLFNNIVGFEFALITMKTKLVVRPDIIARRNDEKLFFSAILGFNPHWDYKHYNEYISQKNVNLSSTNKMLLKCDVINGSVVDGLRKPIFNSFVLDKPSGYKVFCEPETIQ